METKTENKSIFIGYMYRDGANYKTCEEVAFNNDVGVTPKQVIDAFKDAGIDLFDPIILQEYGLDELGFKILSPIQNLFDVGDELNHPYHEITRVVDHKIEANSQMIKISDLVNKLRSVTNDDVISYRKKQAEKMKTYHLEIHNKLLHYIETGDDSKLDLW